MKKMYRAVMDPKINPLSNLLPQRRFQIMVVLSLMWTTIFSTVSALWFLYDELVLGHLLLAGGTLVTAETFRSARKFAARQVATQRLRGPDEPAR